MLKSSQNTIGYCMKKKMNQDSQIINSSYMLIYVQHLTNNAIK